ncbi:MAG: MFS transporter [Gammaproteobacteria bacterium]
MNHSSTLPWWQVLYKYSVFEAGDSAWSLIIVSTYFGTFLQVVLKEPGADFGWAVTLGALIIAVISPLLGAAADDSGRRQPYLRVFVLAVVLCTAALGWTRHFETALVLFVLAYVCVNGAFAFFTAMIPAVSNKDNVSTIVSMTVGLGYAGAFICMMSLSQLVQNDAQAGRVFLPMAVIYLVLALPAMFLSPDFKRRHTARLDFRTAYRRIHATFHEARRYRYLFRFLIGDFLYENAVASIITLMGLYARNVMHFQAHELAALFGPAIIVAMLSAWFVFGPLVRKLGPKRAVLIDLAIWLLLFAAVLLLRPDSHFNVAGWLFSGKTLFAVIAAPLTGLGLAGVWSTSRVLLTALTPAEKSGEFWGLYNLSGRSASVLGDATWSLVLTVLGEGVRGYQVAIAVLAVYVLLGGIFIASLPDVRPTAANFVKAG